MDEETLRKERKRQDGTVDWISAGTRICRPAEERKMGPASKVKTISSPSVRPLPTG